MRLVAVRLSLMEALWLLLLLDLRILVTHDEASSLSCRWKGRWEWSKVYSC
jgi:hypothetical protein